LWIKQSLANTTIFSLSWENSNTTLAEQWASVRGQLRAEVGDAAFNSWLKPLTLGEILGSRLRITVPTRFMRDWIEQNYGDRLTELWQEEDSSVTEVEIIVEPISSLIKTPSLSGRDKSTNQQNPSAIPLSDQGVNHAESNSGQFDTKNVTDLLDKRFIFKNFIVGRTNELAHAAARRAAESDSVQFKLCV
jgi:chromosomal replication initiator protein